MKGGHSGSSWFPIYELTNDDSLAFAVDVKIVEKWASEKPRKPPRQLLVIGVGWRNAIEDRLL